MANLHISEFFGLASGDQASNILAASAEAHITDQVVALGASSAASAAFNRSTRYVRLLAGGPCAIAFGTGPTAVVGGWFLASGEELWVRVPQGLAWEVAAITDTP